MGERFTMMERNLEKTEFAGTLEESPEEVNRVCRGTAKDREDIYEIRKATVQDAAVAAGLAIQMWQGNEMEELREEFQEILQDGKAAVYLQYKGEKAIGFAQCQLRRDYVEGTETSLVGYLEGIFVEEAYRRQGCAGKLLAACENWAREQGCTEFASDCELDNADSLNFHLSV